MKKIFLKMLLALCLFNFTLINVFAATNPYSRNFGENINCTWYAWQAAYDRLGVTLPAWGNANTWLNYARNSGYETGSTPRANSIVVWQWSSYGHVGYVERVKGDKIYVWDSVNTDGCPAEMPDFYDCLDSHTEEEINSGACNNVSRAPHGCIYPSTYWHNPGDLIGYIYLDNAPKYSTTNGTTNQNIVTKAPAKKSNNANLSSIKIENLDFEFNNETLEYNLEVKNEIENIKIDATVENEKATVEGVGEQKLIVGENTINLVVTAEDGSKKTYTLKIKRKDNNAFLNNLKIGNIKFKFKKDSFNYKFTIPRDLKNITIKATPESELATIEGLGKYKLLEEKNTIKINVTSEDKTVKTYTIVLNKEEKSFFEKINIWFVIGISIVVLATLIFVTIILLKKKKIKKSNEKDINMDKKKSKSKI